MTPASEPRARQRVIAIVNHKGGVGKTTTAVNLGTALAAIGKTVLLLDLDHQGNASTSLGISRGQVRNTTHDILISNVPLEESIIPTLVPGLSIAPGDKNLAGADLELASAPRRSFRLRDALDQYLARQVHRGQPPQDYVLIDCPPALNTLTINAMTTADSVLVPLQTEFLALEGLAQLMSTVEIVKSSLNPQLALMGILLTMYDRRTNLADQVVADVRGHFGDLVYDTVIPRNVRLSEAPSHGKPALLYDHTCPGSQAYMRLASEMIQRNQIGRAAA
jgi:chromosome partitioning protein